MVGLEAEQNDDSWFRYNKELRHREYSVFQENASTPTSDELLDTGQLLAELFYKLYHEKSVTIFDSQALRYACRCSRERVTRSLTIFPRIEIEAMYVDKELSLTYEYRGTEYAFGTSDIETLFSHQ